MKLARIPAPTQQFQQSLFEADTAVRRRSVALGSDPAMREMVHFVGSHEHDSRLKVGGVGCFSNNLWV